MTAQMQYLFYLCACQLHRKLYMDKMNNDKWNDKNETNANIMWNNCLGWPFWNGIHYQGLSRRQEIVTIAPLEGLIWKFERKKGHQLVFASLKPLCPDSLNQLAHRKMSLLIMHRENQRKQEWKEERVAWNRT